MSESTRAVTSPRVCSSSTFVNALSSRARTIRAAVLGPMPGSDSSSAAEAWLISTLRSDSLPTLPAGGVSPYRGTYTRAPSRSVAALFRAAGSASGVVPPAAASTSATRAPEASRTTPGRATAPSTSTTMSGGGVGSGVGSTTSTGTGAGARARTTITSAPAATATVTAMTSGRGITRRLAGSRRRGKPRGASRLSHVHVTGRAKTRYRDHARGRCPRVLDHPTRGPGETGQLEWRRRKQRLAPFTQVSFLIRGQRQVDSTSRPDAMAEGLPPLIEARVLDARHEDRVLDMTQTGPLEELDKMTSAGASQRGLVPRREAEVASRPPERGHRRPLAGVIPDGCHDGTLASRDSRHLAQPRYRIGHEVNDKLRERCVEDAVGVRQPFRRSAANVDAGVSRTRSHDEGFGRIDRHD